MKLFHGAAIAAVALAMSGVAMAEGGASKAVQLTDAQMAANVGGYYVINSGKGYVYSSDHLKYQAAVKVEYEGKGRTATSSY
jgi:hypothetical protein